MIPVSKAIKIVERESGVLGTETVPLSSSVGRVLAENIVADGDMPPFDRSQMDGYALREQDVRSVPAILKIVGESAAGRGWHKRLGRGESVRIMTGAPVPAGADAIQKIELTKESNGSVEIIEPSAKGRYIVKKGLEIRKGASLFHSGQVINEKMIATLAAFGYPSVRVAEQPFVSILATGSEIVPVEKKPGRDQIRNSNSVMLKALCEQAGAKTKILRQTVDDLVKLKRVISRAVDSRIKRSPIANRKSQILVITGGVSVGKYDLTKVALKELGAEIFFERVQLKPGKPTVFARLGDTLIFGLPGNPVSAAVTFYLFVRMVILKMQAASETALPGGSAILTAFLKGAGERDSYLPATLATDPSGRLLVTPLRWHGSSDFVSFAKAEALILLPKGTSAATGEVAKVLFI
jgi:molybdenum cofactor synthesis domain-containing protein